MMSQELCKQRIRESCEKNPKKASPFLEIHKELRWNVLYRNVHFNERGRYSADAEIWTTRPSFFLASQLAPACSRRVTQSQHHNNSHHRTNSSQFSSQFCMNTFKKNHDNFHFLHINELLMEKFNRKLQRNATPSLSKILNQLTMKTFTYNLLSITPSKNLKDSNTYRFFSISFPQK